MHTYLMYRVIIIRLIIVINFILNNFMCTLFVTEQFFFFIGNHEIVKFCIINMSRTLDLINSNIIADFQSEK